MHHVTKLYYTFNANSNNTSIYIQTTLKIILKFCKITYVIIMTKKQRFFMSLFDHSI